MHLKLDDEIVGVERRIAGRKQAFSAVGREAGRRSRDVLASPVTLDGARALGFAVGGGLGRRKEKPSSRRAADRTAKAKAGGVVGLALSGAMWLVKQQFGGPVGLARFLVGKFQQRNARA